MKKVIFGALLVASIGTLSAFTSKTDTAVAGKTQLGTADGKTQLGTADGKTQLGTADEKGMLGTADARKAKVAHDQTQLGTAD